MPPRSRRRSASSRPTTCSKVPGRSSRSANPSTTADEPGRHGGIDDMSEIGRFGVFLPSYVWAGDGPDRARGIKAFARTVEELGFDSLFITDHLLVGKRFYSVNLLEALLLPAVPARGP